MNGSMEMGMFFSRIMRHVTRARWQCHGSGKIIESMPRRKDALKAAKVGQTKY
jgi:hypothetical protein